MATDINKSGGAKKVGRKPAEKVGVIPAPATVPQPVLRDLSQPGIRKPRAEIDTRPWVENTPAASAAAQGGTSGRSAGSESASSVGGSGASAAERDAAPQRQGVEFLAPEADEEAHLRYESALADLEALQGKAPTYTSRYDAQIRDLYEQITGRAPFRYDSATDPLYQQYRQGYIQQGQMAMRDTMGQAAALTGGYGSSYAQSVGQQQYDAYLRRLADILPETYGMALDAWKAEGDALRGKYETTAALEKSDYERYLDELGQYDRALSAARSDAEAAYERMLEREETAYSRAADDYQRRMSADKLDYARQQDAYTRLRSLMAAGYVPTTEEYAAAGLSRKQGEALRAQLAPGEEPTVVYRAARSKDGDKSKSKNSSKSKLSGTKKGSGDLNKNLTK